MVNPRLTKLCEFCGEGFKEHLRRHIQNVHVNELDGRNIGEIIDRANAAARLRHLQSQIVSYSALLCFASVVAGAAAEKRNEEHTEGF